MGSIKAGWIRSSKDVPVDEIKERKISAITTIKWEDGLVKYIIEAETFDGIVEEMRRIINEHSSE
jgi:hypothetical protein